MSRTSFNLKRCHSEQSEESQPAVFEILRRKLLRMTKHISGGSRTATLIFITVHTAYDRRYCGKLQFVDFSIQQEHAEVQIAGKGNPCEVREQQKSRGFSD